MTQKEMVKKLNDLRIENNKKPLKNCKLSKKDISLQIIKEATEKAEKVEVKIVEEITTITAVEIAQELGVDPKTLRRKIRKLADKMPATEKPGRWIFKIEVKANLIELLA